MPASNAPEDGEGTPMKNRPEADHHAEGGIDGELRQEIVAEPLPRVVKRDGRAVQVVRAEQAGSSGRADPPAASG